MKQKENLCENGAAQPVHRIARTEGTRSIHQEHKITKTQMGQNDTVTTAASVQIGGGEVRGVGAGCGRGLDTSLIVGAAADVVAVVMERGQAAE